MRLCRSSVGTKVLAVRRGHPCGAERASKGIGEQTTGSARVVRGLARLLRSASVPNVLMDLREKHPGITHVARRKAVFGSGCAETAKALGLTIPPPPSGRRSRMRPSPGRTSASAHNAGKQSGVSPNTRFASS